MTIVIDSITHQLNAMQIIKKLAYGFMNNVPAVQVVISNHETLKMPGNLRNALSRYYRDKKIPSHERFGLYISDPMPFSFGDDRVGKYTALHITPHWSTTKMFSGIINESIREFNI